MKKKSHIVMVGPSLESWGGIAAVAKVYKSGGLFDRWPILYISSYRDGNVLTKFRAALGGLLIYLYHLLTGRVALLHVHSASRSSFLRKSLFVLPTLVFKKPVIFHIHGGEFIAVYGTELGYLTRAYVRFILARCSKIVVLSNHWKLLLESISAATPIHVIMNPIDGSTKCKSWSKCEPQNKLLFLGTLTESKGIFHLLDAVSRLPPHLDWHVQIGGIGETDRVQRKISELGIGDKVELLGWVAGARKIELLGAATALILPSFAEGLPMSVLEAMAHGTAVITTPVGGIPDLMEDGREGFLVPPGDSGRLAGAIARVLADPALAATMGKYGRKKFENSFSSDVIIPQLECLYSEMGICSKGRCSSAHEPA